MHSDNHPYDETELNYPDTLRITVMSGHQALDHAVETAGEAERDEQSPAVVSFESVSGVRKLLTDRRVEALEALMNEGADSITELADRLDRSYSVVHDDVDVLAGYGIIKFREQGTGQSRGVFIPYETIEVNVTIRGTSKTDGEKAPA